MKRSNVRPGRGRELTPKKRNTRSRLPTSCRHCGLPGRRPKGLCWKCFSDPQINEQYQSLSKYHPTAEKDFAGPAPLGEPTDALPGTEEKMLAMEDRARRGLAIFHPADAGRGIDDATERQLRALGMFQVPESDDPYEDDQ